MISTTTGSRARWRPEDGKDESAAAIGGYQPLIRAYIGQGLRRDQFQLLFKERDAADPGSAEEDAAAQKILEAIFPAEEDAQILNQHHIELIEEGVRQADAGMLHSSEEVWRGIEALRKKPK